MNKAFAVMLGMAVASCAMAAPVVFDDNLMKGKDDRFVKVVAHKADVAGLGSAKKLRFMFLVPKLGADFTGGFSSGLTPRVHDKLKLGEGEHLTELVGLSDCTEWLALVMGVFSGGMLSHKTFFGDKGDLKLGTGLGDMVDFVKDKVTSDLMKEMLKLMPSHVMTHMLMGKFSFAM